MCILLLPNTWHQFSFLAFLKPSECVSWIYSILMTSFRVKFLSLKRYLRSIRKESLSGEDACLSICELVSATKPLSYLHRLQCLLRKTLQQLWFDANWHIDKRTLLKCVRGFLSSILMFFDHLRWKSVQKICTQYRWQILTFVKTGNTWTIIYLWTSIKCFPYFLPFWDKIWYRECSQKCIDRF
jgi:hypothetical protein